MLHCPSILPLQVGNVKKIGIIPCGHPLLHNHSSKDLAEFYNSSYFFCIGKMTAVLVCMHALQEQANYQINPALHSSVTKYPYGQEINLWNVWSQCCYNVHGRQRLRGIESGGSAGKEMDCNSFEELKLHWCLHHIRNAAAFSFINSHIQFCTVPSIIEQLIWTTN